MIRVWMLTWPVTERSQQDEEKRSIAVELRAKRSKSFHALKAYFSNLGSNFKHPKNSSEQEEVDEMIQTEAEEEIEKETKKVEREVPVTNVDIHKMIADFQPENAVTVEKLESSPTKVDIIESVQVAEEEPMPAVEPVIDIHLEEIETPNKTPVQVAEEEEEPEKIEEENVETIDVFAMIKGFEHIKKDPNAKEVPKEFRKRTTVTLTKH